MSSIDLAKYMLTRAGQSREGLAGMLAAKLGLEAAETQRDIGRELTAATDRLATYTRVLVIIGIVQAVAVVIAALIARG
jgi:hypothetical protein